MCSISKCKSKAVGRGYCFRHWQQWRKHGEVLTREVRTESPIKEYDDYARVALLDTYDNIVNWTLISTVDIPLVMGRKLRCDKGRYAVMFGNGHKTMYLHRLIFPESKEVDHINNDGLDNRRSNIRPATHRQNAANKISSRIKGVRKRGNKWEAYISNSGIGGAKWKYLGLYSTRQEAISAYNQAAVEQWGEFAHLNPLQ